MRKLLSSIGLICALSLTSACSVQLDKTRAQAQTGAPESTQIEVVSIPYNSEMPTIVFAVEPFIFQETLQQGRNISRIQFVQGGEQIAAKFTTGLANVANFSVIDSGLIKDSGGMYKAKMLPGEIGPFIVRATITEFTENAESSDRKRGGLGYSGRQAERQGMVGIDFRVVDGSTGRVFHGFKSEGTFKSASNEARMNFFGIGGGEKKFAQSVLGQAVTAAINDAVVKINSRMEQRFTGRP
jgi:curli biogenesis system outer membrane secretion channel CsgG